jgi:antitoxin ParD1/3/4
MTKPLTINLTDKARATAEKQAAEQGWDSVEAYLEDIVVEHLMDVTFGTPDLEAEPDPAFLAEIDRRLDTPRDQWIPWDGEALKRQIKEDFRNRRNAKQRAAE